MSPFTKPKRARASDLKLRLESERLVLRPLKVNDVSIDYVSWLNDPEVSRYLESRAKHHSLSSVKCFVRENLKNKTSILFGLFLRSTGEHIGNIRLHQIDSVNLTAELGFLIGSNSNWGKGFTSEAILRVVQFGIKHLGIRKYTAGLYEENVGSRRALEKAGFVLEGVLKGQVVRDDNTRGAVIRMGLCV
jgi:RimJ/RimL family protein N-acetyltransferase